jgi:hypothetical protein
MTPPKKLECRRLWSAAILCRSVFQFAQNHGIDGQVRFMTSQPFHYHLFRHTPGRFTQNVGIDKVFQKDSVESDSSGRNQSVSGQAISQ